AAELRNRDVAFVDEEQRVVGQVVKQAGRRLTGATAGQIPRVVLDAGAVTDLHDHFHVEARALLEALRLDELVRLAQTLELNREVGANLLDGAQQRIARRDVVRLRIDRDARHRALHLARQRIEVAELGYLVVEQRYAHGTSLEFRRVDVDYVSAHAIRASGEIQRVTR